LQVNLPLDSVVHHIIVDDMVYDILVTKVKPKAAVGAPLFGIYVKVASPL
jgi:hypothetical protein